MHLTIKLAIILIAFKISETRSCDERISEGDWVKANDGEIPPGTIIGGVDKTLKPVYVCRAKHDSHLIPGRLIADSKFCATTYGYQEKTNTQYEVLTCALGVWVPIFDKGVISGSNFLPAGYQIDDPIYIGRCHHDNSLLVGKVHNGAAFIGHEGKELFCKEYEMFMSTGLIYNSYAERIYHLFGNKGPYFPFRVRASKNIAIALTNNKNILYEIIIGGNDNSVSSIAKDGARPFAASVSTPAILDEDSYRGFWIHWHYNKLRIGREGERTAFLSFTANNIYQINTVGIKTHEVNGTWAIEKMPFVFHGGVLETSNFL